MLVVPLYSLVFQLSYKGVHSFEILLPMEGLPPPANAGDTGATGWIPGSGRYLEEEMATGNGYSKFTCVCLAYSLKYKFVYI